MLRKSLYIVALVLPTLSYAQGQTGIKVQNLPNFDLRYFHFGFLLSYNTADFYMKVSPDAFLTDSVLSVEHIKRPGFNLGIISSLNMTPNLSLRFLPSLSFQDRILRYRIKQDDGSTLQFDKAVESTYIEFPLLLKFRSDRINNAAFYLVGGGKFSIDMASQKDVNNEIDDEIVVKLEKYDYSAEVGGGMDMFLPYFKFGIELKIGIGLKNLLIDDNTKFSRSIESLRTKNYMLTFTFEG